MWKYVIVKMMQVINYRLSYCTSIKPQSVSYSIMSSFQMQAADFQPPKQRSIYLITFSQCGDSGLNKSEFAELFMRSRNALAQKNTAVGGM